MPDLHQHLTASAALGLVACVLLLDAAPWTAFVVLLALAIWYAALVVVPVRTEPGGADTRQLVYILGAIALVTALVLLSPFAAALLIMLYAQAFWLLQRLWLATVSIALGTVATGLAVGTHVEGQLAEVTVLANGVGCFLVGNTVGLLIRRQAEQQRIREKLIEDLYEARAKLATAHRLEGVGVERERMAREIHDTLAQGFTSLVMLIQTADAALDRDPELVRRQLALAERTARDNLTQARALVASGEPAPLGEDTIEHMVSRLAGNLSELANLECTASVGQPHRELSANEQVVLVRATQEALANVYRHARASQVAVRLGAGDEGTVLDIEDDGCGFHSDRTRGFGLTSMRSRIEEVGGRLRIVSTPGRGTHVRVVLP